MKAMMTRNSFLNLKRETNQMIVSIAFLSSTPLLHLQDHSAWLVLSKAHIQAALAKFPWPLPNLQHLSWYPPSAPTKGQTRPSFSAGCGQICTWEGCGGALRKHLSSFCVLASEPGPAQQQCLAGDLAPHGNLIYQAASGVGC